MALRIIRLALTYWAAIFALGFVLGSARVLAVAPRIGETAAVLVELPLMIAASWLVARRLLTRRMLAKGEALAMGALAFALLMASELLLVLMLGSTVRQWLMALGTLPGAIGLLGQLAFAAIPAAISRRL